MTDPVALPASPIGVPPLRGGVQAGEIASSTDPRRELEHALLSGCTADRVV